MIAAGHRWPDVLDYTPRQLRLFYEQAVHRDNSWRGFIVESVNMGCWGTKEKIKQFLRQLTGGR